MKNHFTLLPGITSFEGVNKNVSKTVIYFASGSNHAGEIRGLSDASHALGVAAPEVREDAIREMERSTTPVFIDSGAFSEVKFGPSGIEVVKPMLDRDWEAVFDLYERVGSALGSRCYVVAPDRVGCQVTTLERLERYAPIMLDLHKMGVQVMVPVQRGALSLADFYAKACEVLGFTPIAALPCKKAATNPAEVAAFVAEAQPAKVHLLGVGPASPDYAAYIAATGDAQVSCDSVRIRALVGRSNGKGGAPRPLTVATDAAASELAVECWADSTGMVTLDYTDSIAEELDVWLTGALATRTAKNLGVRRGQLHAFIEDNRALPHVDWAVDQAWAEFHANHTISEKKRRAIVSVFLPNCDRQPSAAAPKGTQLTLF